MRRWTCGLVSFALLGAACNGAEPDAPEQQPVAGMPGAPGPAVDPTAGPVDLERRYLVRLEGLEGRPASGTVGLSPVGDQTRVEVRLEQATTAGIHRGFLRSGERCDDIGGTRAELPPVTVGTAGEGEGTGMLEMRMDEFMDGNALAVYHAPDGDPGQAVLCGPIPLLPPDLPVEGEGW